MAHLPEARREQLWETHYHAVIEATITSWMCDSALLAEFLDEQEPAFCPNWPEAKLGPQEALAIALDSGNPVKQRINALEALRFLFGEFWKESLDEAATQAANEHLEDLESGVDEGDD